MKILVTASTFPSSDADSVPAFVKDQIIAFKSLHPSVEISVLAPHNKYSNTRSFATHPAYDEYRFHYFWPHRFESLTGRSILPALKANPLNYLLIPFLFAAEFLATLKLARKLKPDFIYAHWFTPQAVTAAWVSRITGIPFVYTTHASDVLVWSKVPGGPLIVNYVSRRARAITSVSRRSLSKLRSFFDDRGWQQIEPLVEIIPMGVGLETEDSREADALKKNLGIDPGSKVILFVGRLAEKKGVTYLLKAFANVLKSKPNAVLVIAGDGQLRDELEAEAAALDVLGATVFAGYINGQAKKDYFAVADIVALPSIITSDGDSEGLPVVLMEGLAYGKMCIATLESGADEIITDGKDGFLVPQKDTQALQSALTKALDLSPQDLAAIQENAKRTAVQFSWPSVAERTFDFLFKH